MKRIVRLLPSAERDIARLEAFLADQSPAAASRAARTIREALLTLDEYAERARKLEDGRRELIISFGRSAYIAQFRVYGRDVVVARIFHARERR